LATLTLNSVTSPINPKHSFAVAATPTNLQRRAFELLGVKLIYIR
jgi:hypothetical protein